MADKRIQDFPTLPEAQDTDLILVGARNDTYNMSVATLKKASKEEAELSRLASEHSRDAAEAAQSAAEQAAREAENANIDPDDLGLEQDEETGVVYPTYKGVRSENGIPLATTGGVVDGTGLTYTAKVTNELPSRAIIVPEGAAAELKFHYSSVDEEGYDDGGGVGVITIDKIKVATINVYQGSNTVDIAAFLTPGEHTVKVKVSNTEGSSSSVTYTVTLVSLSMSTTLDALAIYSGDVVFYYTPVGTGNKTVHFIMDGEELDTEVVPVSGKGRSYIIPEQSHGGHVFEAYAELTVEGTKVKSNTITLGMMWVDSSKLDSDVVSSFDVTAASQGETLTIDYLAYDPATESAAVTLSVINPDGSVYSSKSLTVPRTPQTWTVNDYPAGTVTFRLAVNSAYIDKVVKVAESGYLIVPVTDGLALNFDAKGRSNQEDNPAVWTDGTTTATFRNVSFAGADGWLTDADGCPMLRLLPDSEVTLPFKLFANDCKINGATVEVEMATNNVRDYDSVVISCLSGGRGFKIASQYAQLKSELSEISMQFKEEKRVRVSFVVGPKNDKHMIYVYVDGVMCGAIQYPPENDDFSQNPAAGITIGAESSGIDIYRIALYTKGLSRQEILGNYIADRATLGARIAAHRRNDVMDVSENIVIPKLPAGLPYMVISCPELPQFKGDKKTCEITYVDTANPEKSFTAAGVSIDVQGTSSAGYKKKNFLIKLIEGLTMTKAGTEAEAYALSNKSLPVSAFCLKADVASSDNANNVELVRLYNDTCPYRHPAMQADSRVRYGIEGYPIVVFWQNTATGETTFWGKYNFNNDKSTPEAFGWGAGYECWEIKNNTSDRVTFHKSDYGEGVDKDFEAVYPDKFTDYTNLKKLTDWLVSTDRTAVTTDEEKAARLEKFKTEFESYFVKNAMLYYYLFTETFLMVDNRAKNFFPTYDPNLDRWYPFPYDMDTALGINNEGQLVFDYDLEDTDQLGGYDIFNGQSSVLWCNVRDAFGPELVTMYQGLRSANTEAGETLFSYETVFKRFADHQETWPEAVWNEDAYEKYLRPLFDENDASYLTMLQGDKASQRDWWSFNGFRYRDSKYQAGDANTNYITLRCYNVGDITVTPYSHIWPRIKYGSYTVTERGKRNVATTLVNPLDKMDDTETYIYSADRLADIGDLSNLQVGYADFTAARKLQKLKLGDGAADFQNTKLTELYVGNNDLLTELDVRNCIGLTATVDLSGCDGLETVKAKGSSATGFTLPIGGHIKTLELPGTIANFTIRSQKFFESVTFEGYGALTTLRVENTPNVPIETIISSAGSLNRVRLVGVEWQAASVDTLMATVTKLNGCIGIDAAGNNTQKAVVSGRVHVPSITDEQLMTIHESFPDLTVIANGVTKYFVQYLNYDGTVLYTTIVNAGADAIDPVAENIIDAPTREETAANTYTYAGWGRLPTNIQSNTTIIAQYIADVRTYTVRFYNGTSLLQTVNNVPYGSDATYTGNAPTKKGVAKPADFSHVGWSPAPISITGPTDCYAQFEFIGSYTRALIEKTLSGDYENDRVTEIGSSVFSDNDYLGSVNFPKVTIVGESAFSDISSLNYSQWQCLTRVNLPVATTLSAKAFYRCGNMQEIAMPAVTSIGEQCFYQCTGLTTLDLPAVATIETKAFQNCAGLTAIILRRVSGVCTLGNKDAFNGTPIASGTGYIYVPQALKNSYATATNWSNYAAQIRAIEDYPEICGGE